MILGEVKARPKDIISFSLDYISKSKVQTSNPSSSPTPLDTPARPADLIHIDTNWERLYRFLPNPNAPLIPGATWEPWRIPPAICVTTLGGRLHVTTCTWDRKLTVKCWMAVSYIHSGMLMAEKREMSGLKTFLETLLMKLDQIGHFMVCVSYKWYLPMPFKWFQSLSKASFGFPSVYSHSFKKHTVQG